MTPITFILAEAAAGVAHEAAKTDVLSVDVKMIVLTWTTFLCLLAVLTKFAWKPILAGLENRENSIRQAVEEAEKTHLEYQRVEETRVKIIHGAEDEAKEIIAQSRKGAVTAAKVIEQKAKESSQILLENAQREILRETEKAEIKVRQESTDLVLNLAGKVISENLDDAKNRAMIDRLIKDI